MTPDIIAYFSMEIALEPSMPTYSGGLGMLAGDTIRSAADLKLPMVAVSLVHRKGYFKQVIEPDGRQIELPAVWQVETFCREAPERVKVSIEGRTVHVRAWRHVVKGITGHEVPVFLLDTHLPENSEWDRALTDQLYGGDEHYRLCQEVVLGIGGVRMLRALGCANILRFHMNEGHASLLALELLDEQVRQRVLGVPDSEDIRHVRDKCVFTTHTPVPAGHDKFSLDHVARVLGRSDLFTMKEVFCCGDQLNMTYLALNLSHYVNGVAKKHGEVSRQMLAPRDANHHYQIDSITNGIHLSTWASPSMASLFDLHLPGWRGDNSSLRRASCIPSKELWEAHATAKAKLIEAVNRRGHPSLDGDTFTLGFARRATGYKRLTLLLTDLPRLKSIAADVGGIQIIFAGKAHPRDEEGKQCIRQIVRAAESLAPEVRLVYLQDYDWRLARLLVAGADVWLNTPLPPLEASGTSGMKAAVNGVPSLSTLDGWWIEGCVEGVTGWSVGGLHSASIDLQTRAHQDAASLYDKLEHTVLPLYLRQRDRFVAIMRQAISLNASHFNTQRMVQEYAVKAYLE